MCDGTPSQRLTTSCRNVRINSSSPPISVHASRPAQSSLMLSGHCRARHSRTRIPSGVPGLDEVLQGGLPRGALLLIEGPPGSGKPPSACNFCFRVSGRAKLAYSRRMPRRLNKSRLPHHTLGNLTTFSLPEPATANGDDVGSGYTLFPEGEVDLGETLREKGRWARTD